MMASMINLAAEAVPCQAHAMQAWLQQPGVASTQPHISCSVGSHQDAIGAGVEGVACQQGRQNKHGHDDRAMQHLAAAKHVCSSVITK